MGTYAMNLKQVCELVLNYPKQATYNQINKLISDSVPVLFTPDLKFNPVSWDTVLKSNVIRRNLYIEIGFETPQLFLLQFDETFRRVYYVYQKYLDAFTKKFDFLENFKTEETVTRDETRHGTDHTESNVSGDNINKFSDTPEQNLKNTEDGIYLTTLTINNSSSNGNSDSNNTNTSNQNAKIIRKGKEGSETYSEMIDKYRKSIFNIQEMFNREFSDCFIQLWL